MLLGEGCANRFRNCGVVLLATDFFLDRTMQADEVIARDPAFLRVKFRERGGLRNLAIKDNDRAGRELIVRARARDEQKSERAKDDCEARSHLRVPVSDRHTRCGYEREDQIPPPAVIRARYE